MRGVLAEVAERLRRRLALQLGELEARAAVRNGRGNRALQKLGAVQECRLRNSFLKNGEYIDQTLYAMLDTDWRGSRAPVSAPPVRVH